MKLSVVSPVLNEQFFLPLFLKSVLTYADEVIILDGGSVDGTLEVIRSFQQETDKIKVFVNPQNGIPYTDDWNEGSRRNFLLDQASGDWILVLDADEMMSDNFAFKFKEIIQDPDIDIYGFSRVSFWQSPNTVRTDAAGDTNWAGAVNRLWRNNGKIRFSGSHHCLVLYEGRPVWERLEKNRVFSDIEMLHYHYALGPRFKFNDNRRGDVNRFNNMGEPDWNYQPGNYPIVTAPYAGTHPQVIRDFLAGNPFYAGPCKEIPALDLIGISFDRYQRFQCLAGIVNDIAPKGLKILDIGLEDGDFSLFIPEHMVTWLDKSGDPGDPSIPFPDNSFDVVLGVDVLGVMDSGLRNKFIQEVFRVARSRAVIATPHAGAMESERLIYNLTLNRYLKPHLDLGLPSESELEENFLSWNIPFNKVPNSGLASWLGMLFSNHYLSGDDWRELNRFFNTNFALEENRYPCFRVIYVLDLSKV